MSNQCCHVCHNRQHHRQCSFSSYAWGDTMNCLDWIPTMCIQHTQDQHHIKRDIRNRHDLSCRLMQYRCPSNHSLFWYHNCYDLLHLRKTYYCRYDNLQLYLTFAFISINKSRETCSPSTLSTINRSAIFHFRFKASTVKPTFTICFRKPLPNKSAAFIFFETQFFANSMILTKNFDWWIMIAGTVCVYSYIKCRFTIWIFSSIKYFPKPYRFIFK